MDFTKALKVESVELHEELLWEYPRGFLEDLWSEIKYHLSKLGEVKWNLYRFLERVDEEVQRKGWDLRRFRHSKSNEPVTNLFKKLIREVAKESEIELSNDVLSRLLNYVRNQYSTEGVLSAGIFPVEAFMKRKDYNLPFDLGDENSCFRSGGCNEGSALWLQREEEMFDRAKLVVFHYKTNNREGVGRCWVYKVSEHAIFGTNFYSRGFDIKAQYFKYPIVRVLRKLFGLSEETRFAFNKNISLPIYLNGDGLIIYEKEHYSQSDEVIETARKIESKCMICKEVTTIDRLFRLEKEMLYEDKDIRGLIVCSECLNFYESAEMCAGCGEYYWKDEMIVDKEGNWLCLDCANKHRRACIVCGEWFYPEEVIEYASPEVKTIYVCENCECELKKIKCEDCGKEFYYTLWDYKWSLGLRELVRLDLCYKCYKKRLEEWWNETFKNRRQPHLPFDLFDIIMIEP